MDSPLWKRLGKISRTFSQATTPLQVSAMPVEDVRELAASDVPERNETIAGAIRLSLGMPAIAAIDDLFERARLDGDGEGDSPSSSASTAA
jgi:hypothetical protein